MDINEMKRRIIDKIKKENIDISALDSMSSKESQPDKPASEVKPEPIAETPAPEPTQVQGAVPEGVNIDQDNVKVSADFSGIEQDEGDGEGVSPEQTTEAQAGVEEQVGSQIDPEKILKEKYKQIFGEALSRPTSPPPQQTPARDEPIQCFEEGLNRASEEMIARLTSELSERDKKIEEFEKRYFKNKPEEMKAEYERASSEISVLQARLHDTEQENREQATRVARLEDALKAKENKLIECRNLELEKHNMVSRIQELENEIKQLSQDMENGNSKTSAELSAHDRNFAAEKNELLIKLSTSERECRDLEGKINQLNLELKAKNKRLEDTEKLYKGLDDLIRDAAVKVQAIGMEKRELEEKFTQVNADLEIKSKKLVDVERYFKSIEIGKNELELKLQAAEKERAELSTKVSQFTIEIDAKGRRLEETERLSKELDQLVRDISLRLQAAERDKKEQEDRVAQLTMKLDSELRKRESERLIVEESLARFKIETDLLKRSVDEKQKIETELRQNVASLQSEVDARDKKIEADIRYYEKVVKEINELRQKIKR